MINKFTFASSVALAGNAIEQKTSNDNFLLTESEKCADEKYYVDSILNEF
jgi:hypothetical protein